MGWKEEEEEPYHDSQFKHAYEDINYVQEDDELPLLVNKRLEVRLLESTRI